MSTHGPTNWATGTHPEYPGFIKQAKAAAKKGDPDPTKFNLAPACFWALRQMAVDQLHHQAGFMLADIEADRLVLAAHGHVEPVLAVSTDLDEAQERRLVMVRQARERIASRFQRFQTEVHSIVANWARMNAEMQQIYRRYYPYANHVGELEFPELDPTHVRYGDDDGGFSMATLLPNGPTGDQPELPVLKGALAQ